VLSELPEEWSAAVERWRGLASVARGEVDDRPAPEPTLEYAFYQSLLGAWPFGADARVAETLVERMSGYLLKAAREAKTETSWLSPNTDYESKLAEFVRKLLGHADFVRDFAGFAARVDRAGAMNALGQTLLRACVPGVPDTYQGSELWNQSLVDPDNRRPVDYELRRRLLSEITAKLERPAALASELLETYPDGRVKMLVTHVALRLRRREPELFAQGDYVALEAGEHAIAFARVFEDKRVACVVPRLSLLLTGGSHFPLAGAWGEQAVTGLDHGRYRELFTGTLLDVQGPLPLAQLFSVFPLALLVKEPS
jgi:(1->4)-alpha-D-glucan 1-alpha-D-glucosylmutase